MRKRGGGGFQYMLGMAFRVSHALMVCCLTESAFATFVMWVPLGSPCFWYQSQNRTNSPGSSGTESIRGVRAPYRTGTAGPCNTPADCAGTTKTS